MSVQRVDQGLAVAAARALPEDLKVSKELRTRYRQLAAMLQNAGLAATYAFIASKANPGADRLDAAYTAAERAIRERIFPVGSVPGNARATVGRLGEMDAVDYAVASAEAAAFIGWLRRLADAAWQESGGNDVGSDGEEAEGPHDDDHA